MNMKNTSLKKAYDILMIGDISEDIYIYLNEEQHALGGATVYGPAAASSLDIKMLVVIKANKDTYDELQVLKSRGVEFFLVYSQTTTSIKNQYLTPDKERRETTLRSKAESFSMQEIPDVSAKVMYLASLVSGVLPDSFIPELSNRSPLALDVQGVMRRDINGKLELRDWLQKETLIPYITYLKTDAAEAEVLTGQNNRHKAAEILQDMGADEVMITHHSEVLLGSQGTVFRAPLTPKNLSGRTGRGDTCFSAYLARRLNHGVQKSLDFSAALTSMKLEKPGVFLGSEQEVLNRMSTY